MLVSGDTGAIRGVGEVASGVAAELRSVAPAGGVGDVGDANLAAVVEAFLTRFRITAEGCATETEQVGVAVLDVAEAAELADGWAA